MGCRNIKVFCLWARKFRLKDAQTSFIWNWFDIRLVGCKWKSSLIVINSSYGPYLIKTRETLIQTTAIPKILFLCQTLFLPHPPSSLFAIGRVIAFQTKFVQVHEDTYCEVCGFPSSYQDCSAITCDLRCYTTDCTSEYLNHYHIEHHSSLLLVSMIQRDHYQQIK